MPKSDSVAAIVDTSSLRGSVDARELQKKAHALIPGGAHTYAKGDDQFPVSAPPFIVRGKGCHSWDLDGKEYIEYGMGLRAVTLGHAYEPVVEAAYAAMRKGINFTRPAPMEVECAEALLELVPGADMVKFGKNGSDVTTAAIKIARAYTGRDLIAICGEQPFFSTDDWFIGTLEMNAGIPQAITDLTLKFPYNDLQAVEKLFADHPSRIACLILEAEAVDEPAPGYLASLKGICERNGAVLIFDEMITGFRWHIGGAQAFHGVTPHLATFGKAMSNGFAIGALVGKREIMRLGGIDHDQPRVFLLSTTHGAETHALAATIATMRTYRDEPVIEHLWRQGERLRAQVKQSISEHHLEGHFDVLGRPCNLIFATLDQDRKRSQPYRTLFMQELIRRGIIASSFVVSYSHSDADIDRTAQAVHDALEIYRKALDGGVAHFLNGRPVQPVNRRYN